VCTTGHTSGSATTHLSKARDAHNSVFAALSRLTALLLIRDPHTPGTRPVTLIAPASVEATHVRLLYSKKTVTVAVLDQRFNMWIVPWHDRCQITRCPILHTARRAMLVCHGMNPHLACRFLQPLRVTPP
jgi:hypothetical protein